jgi:mono/diheme cytochrome c family protein
MEKRSLGGILSVAALAAALSLLPAAYGQAAASAAMAVERQNALVQTYCAVCHQDAAQNGGLTLQHFDAAHADPGEAAMILGKLKTGAIGAAGVKPPDDATVSAWISATAAEAAGANHWSTLRTEGPASTPSILSASIVREVPSAQSPGVPDSYRLTVTCRADTHEAGMQLAWSPGVPKKGQVLSALVDGRALSAYTVDGTEKMGNGTDLSSGPGSIFLYSTHKSPEGAGSAMALPAHTLTIRDAFPDETVVFPFEDLPQTTRQALSACFPGSAPSQY